MTNKYIRFGSSLGKVRTLPNISEEELIFKWDHKRIHHLQIRNDVCGIPHNKQFLKNERVFLPPNGLFELLKIQMNEQSVAYLEIKIGEDIIRIGVPHLSKTSAPTLSFELWVEVDNGTTSITTMPL